MRFWVGKVCFWVGIIGIRLGRLGSWEAKTRIIMPVDYKEYHPKWKLIVRLIRNRTINKHGVDCCEGSPKYPNCRAVNKEPHPITGSKVILTTAHIDQNKDNNRFSNLRRLCQRCHLTHDKEQHRLNRKFGRNWKKNQYKLEF